MHSLEFMKKGNAPIGSDNQPINLHHMLQINEGAIAEMTKSFHQQNKRIRHINPPTIKSGINRSKFDAWKEQYWIERTEDFEYRETQ